MEIFYKMKVDGASHTDFILAVSLSLFFSPSACKIEIINSHQQTIYFYFIIIFEFYCFKLYVLCALLHVGLCTSLQLLRRSEEGAESPGARVTGSCALGAGN